MRKIIAYKKYFIEFMSTLSRAEAEKVKRSLDLFKTEDKIPRHYISYIRDGLYEFRVTLGRCEFRIFFIYDGVTLVVLFNALRKKTQKTPPQDIDKALRLKNEYYATKRDE